MNASLLRAAVGLLICFSSKADACTCGSILPCQAYAGVQVVFVGVVTKTGTVNSKGLMPSTAMSTTVSALVPKGIPLVHSTPLMFRVEKVNSPVRLVIRLP
jgi:hypothetical protein